MLPLDCACVVVETFDMSTLHELASEYVKVDDTIHKLEETAKRLRKEKAEIGEKLMTGMIEEGAPSVEVFSTNENGVEQKVRVYPTSKLYARRDPETDEPTFQAALILAGYDALIKQTVNTNSLSAVVRELADDAGVRDAGPSVIKEALPEALAKVLAINTTPTLAIRRK